MATKRTATATATKKSATVKTAKVGKGDNTMENTKKSATAKASASKKAIAPETNEKLDKLTTLLVAEILKGVDVEALVKKAIKENPAPATKADEPKKATGKVSVKDYEPKKDSDGYYNYASWKVERRKYVEAKTGMVLHGKGAKWLSNDEFVKAAAPFAKAYEYVKIANRK